MGRFKLNKVQLGGFKNRSGATPVVVSELSQSATWEGGGILDRSCYEAAGGVRGDKDHAKTTQDRPKIAQDHPKTAQDRSQDQVFIEKGVEKGIEEDSKPGNSRLLGYD